MGIIGGLLGALFNEFNTVISKYRMNHVAKKRASRILRLVATIASLFDVAVAVVCVCMCVHACVRACVRICAWVIYSGGKIKRSHSA